MRGFTIKDYIGVGDSVQFSSLPENYFRATGEKLVDVSKCWVFDHNPYVVRGVTPIETMELWNFGPQQFAWPKPRASVYQSNAEIWASLFGVPVVLNRPRLYRHEDYPFAQRDLILLHTNGRSHGRMPDHVIDHVVNKYGHMDIAQVGLPGDVDLGLPRVETPTLWDLAQVISQARMLIGVDSGPAWIATCYPDVVVKKIRLRTVHGEKSLSDWVPLEIDNIHSHWDDRAFHVFNPTEDDVGFTTSYRKL